MGNVIDLNKYRQSHRKAYLAHHGARLDRTIERFVTSNIDVDFRQLAADYQAASGAWDYVQFREVLADAIDAAFGRSLYEELEAQPWFDHRLITQEEVIDRCLSSYVLSRCEYALLPR